MCKSKYLCHCFVLRIDKHQRGEIVADNESPKLIRGQGPPGVRGYIATPENQHASAFNSTHTGTQELIGVFRLTANAIAYIKRVYNIFCDGLNLVVKGVPSDEGQRGGPLTLQVFAIPALLPDRVVQDIGKFGGGPTGGFIADSTEIRQRELLGGVGR
jgi:hypothetical protein